MWPAQGAPKAQKPHLVVCLDRGWRYDSRRRRFFSAAHREVVPWKDLPKGARIVYMVPELAGSAAEGTLSEDEEKLSRFLHVLLPAGSDPAELLPAVRDWECVETANLPPEVSLPGGVP